MSDLSPPPCCSSSPRAMLVAAVEMLVQVGSIVAAGIEVLLAGVTVVIALGLVPSRPDSVT